MSTSFYGYGLYFTCDRRVIDYYCEQMRDSYEDLFVYTVDIDETNLINENDEIGDKLALELYADFVEQFGSEIKATNKMKQLGYSGMTYRSPEDGRSVIVYLPSIITIQSVEKLKS